MNKPRKKIFYNRLLDCLFIETKPNSGIFRSNINHQNEEYNRDFTLDEMVSRRNIFMDISLFPAHIYKSYGTTYLPFRGDIVWAFMTGKRPFLAYVHDVMSDGYIIRKILTDGIVSRKSIYTDSSTYFKLSKENYKLVQQVKLI